MIKMMGLALVLATLLSVGGRARAADEALTHPGPAVAEKVEREAGAETEAEHETGIDGKKLALQFLNFGVLIFVLVKFGGSAVNKALAARHQQLKADLAAASVAKAEAEARLHKQEQRLANLEKEITDIRAGIAQEAEAEKGRLVAAAEERARRIREEAAFLIDQQVKEGEATLRREAAGSAVKIAEEILRRSMDGRDQQRLLDSFVEDVAGAEAPGAATRAVG